MKKKNPMKTSESFNGSQGGKIKTKKKMKKGGKDHKKEKVEKGKETGRCK